MANQVTLAPMRDAQEDLDLFAACFADNGSPRDMRSLVWQYRNNPVGRSWIELALVDAPPKGKRLAAIYATLPARMRIAGRVRIGLQSLDTLTDSEYRGQGLFLKLAKSTFARAESDGAALIYGFPNVNSAPGFFGKLGWRSLGSVPFLIRPLRSGYIGRRVSQGWIPDVPLIRRRRFAEHTEVQRFDERFSALWAAFSTSVNVAVERDFTYLNWRLVSKPGQHYCRWAVFERDEPVAMVAFGSQEKHGGRVGTILEFIFRPGSERVARGLLADAVQQLAEDKADVILSWCLPHSRNYISYLRCGFFPFLERLRPIQLHFGARSFDAELDGLVTSRASWYVSYLDSDTT